ncbi:MAG: hypothetical protein ACP5LQ_03800 [Candidatus Methanodesulfokora sp.]
MLEIVKLRLEFIKRILENLGYIAEVSPEEFYKYLTGETYTNDKITLKEILDNDYLMIHEVVEINELKKRGLRINRNTLISSPRALIYKAHLKALEMELSYASDKGDKNWVVRRLKDLESYLNEPHLSEELRAKIRGLLERFNPADG